VRPDLPGSDLPRRGPERHDDRAEEPGGRGVRPSPGRHDAGRHLRRSRRVREGPVLQRGGQGQRRQQQGQVDGTTATPTTMSDTPTTRRHLPAGVTKIVSTFEVCAICKATGAILDCITWKYERTKMPPTRGRSPTPRPSGRQPGVQGRVEEYNDNHKEGTICPEEEAEKNKGAQNVKPGTNKKLPVEPPTPNTPFQVMWDIVTPAASTWTARTTWCCSTATADVRHRGTHRVLRSRTRVLHLSAAARGAAPTDDDRRPGRPAARVR